MSSQFARLKHALNRAETTSVGPVQVTVFADDLHSILAHYITVSTELAELKAASATEVCAVIPSIREYVESLESRFAKARSDALEEAAKVCDSLIHYGEVSGVLCAKQIRALKGTQIVRPLDIEGHPV